MNRCENANTVKNNTTDLFADTDANKYFVFGKMRIKVSEHFANKGKPLDSLLEDVIQRSAIAS